MRALFHRVACASAAMLVLSTAVAFAKSEYYVHVRAKEGGKRGVDVAFPWSPSTGGSPLNFTKNYLEVDDVDIRRLWRTLRAQPEGHVITLRKDGETTRVSREEGYCVMRVTPHRRDRDRDRVVVRVPEIIMDMMLDEDARITERDVARLVRARGRVDLVKVDSGRDRVRVWIDREDEWN